MKTVFILAVLPGLTLLALATFHGHGSAMAQAAGSSVCGTACLECDTEPSAGNLLNADANAEVEVTPVACKLGDQALQERRNTVIRELHASARAVREVEQGYSLAFEDNYAEKLLEFIRFERACCPFFEFVLTFEADNGRVWMTVQGQDGVKDFLKPELAPVIERLGLDSSTGTS